MNGFELKFPPLLLTLFVALLMWLVAQMLPAFSFGFTESMIAAAVLAGGGAAIVLAGVLGFRRASTTMNPYKPDHASSMVTSGVYRFSRNPMYLGFLLLLTGWSMVLCNLPALLFLPAFVLYMNRFQIVPEEKVLAAKFGEEFTRYKARVRRWV